MKKLFLILTFLIYIFSIVTEAGLFSFLHADTKAEVVMSEISSDTLSVKALKSDNKNSHCAEESCHVGHCHHVSILVNRYVYDQYLQQVLNDQLNLLSYQNPFLEGHKRPPIHV